MIHGSQSRIISTVPPFGAQSVSKYRNPEISTKIVFIAEKLCHDNQANPKSDSILKYIFLKTSTSGGGKEKTPPLSTFKLGIFLFPEFFFSWNHNNHNLGDNRKNRKIKKYPEKKQKIQKKNRKIQKKIKKIRKNAGKKQKDPQNNRTKTEYIGGHSERIPRKKHSGSDWL